MKLASEVAGGFRIMGSAERKVKELWERKFLTIVKIVYFISSYCYAYMDL